MTGIPVSKYENILDKYWLIIDLSFPYLSKSCVLAEKSPFFKPYMQVTLN